MDPNNQDTAQVKQAPSINQIFAANDAKIKAKKIKNNVHELKQRLLEQAREHNVPIHGETAVTYGSMGGRLVLRLWRDGYTVGSSDLEPYNGPDSMLVLNSLTKGEIPSSITERHDGGVEIEDYQFVHNEPRRERFYGGHDRPAITDGHLLHKHRPKLVVDDEKPKTTLTIRFIGGYSTVEELNRTHLVGDIRSYIASVSPIQDFKLMTEATASTFPRELTDDSETLEEAGLLDASIIQKICQSSAKMAY